MLYKEKTTHTDTIHFQLKKIASILGSIQRDIYIYEDTKIKIQYDILDTIICKVILLHVGYEEVFACGLNGESLEYHKGLWEDYIQLVYNKALETEKEQDVKQKQKEKIEKENDEKENDEKERDRDSSKQANDVFLSDI